MTGTDIVTLNKDQIAQIEKLSDDMSKTSLAVPAHFKGNIGACRAVVRSAIRWGMDPYLVALETSDIKGKLMYSGKLVSAVIAEDPRLEFPLDYKFKGTGEGMVCTVIGKIRGEATAREVNVPMPPKNKRVSDHWNTNPEQQLSYYAARVWARRHLPGKLLGVWTPDDPLAAQYRPQKETSSIMDNIERAANKEPPVRSDDIEGEYTRHDTELTSGDPELNADIEEIRIRLVKSDGTEIDFDNFDDWLNYIKVNISKVSDKSRLDKFISNHAPIFKEITEAGWGERVEEAQAIIQDQIARINEGA